MMLAQLTPEYAQNSCPTLGVGFYEDPLVMC